MKKIIDSKEEIGSSLIDWFNKYKRELPWRETTNPYYILVSEIMLQQTQVSTVIPYYLRFIDRLPTLEALAKVSEEELHKLWEGLGYYSRVRRLQQLAVIVVRDYNSQIPNEKHKLISLPGIGPYTCGAVLSFAFHIKEPAVDGNVKRVLARLLADDGDIMKQATTKRLTKELELILPDDIYAFNQGLIELGALICKPKNPECDHCPLKTYCVAFAENKVDVLPVKTKKAKQRLMNVPILMIENQNKLLFVKRGTSGLLSNQWGLPMIEKDIPLSQMEREIENYLSIEFGIDDQCQLESIGHVKHVFSHIIWEQNVFLIKNSAMINEINAIEQPVTTWSYGEDIAVPSAFKKAIELYIEKKEIL